MVPPMSVARENVHVTADPALCVRCGDCAATCPAEVFSLADDGMRTDNPGHCIGCGHCVAVCPTGALTHSDLPADRFEPVSEEPAFTLAQVRRLLRERRTCRRFTAEDVSPDEIEALIGTASHAPTSTNSQNVRYLVFHGRDQVDRLARLTCGYYLKLRRQLENPFTRLAIGLAVGFKTVGAYRMRMPAIAAAFERTLAGEDRLFYGAPAVVVLFVAGLPHLALANGNLAAAELLLAAPAAGLGACYNGFALTALVRDKQARRAAGIPDGCTPAAVVAFGHPAGRFHRVPPRNRRRIVEGEFVEGE
jgi:nitroreductase/NAD-dependent dihydropyrimidine dehydrogenase PreA subunit